MTMSFTPMPFEKFMAFLPRSIQEYAEAMVIAKEYPNLKIPMQLAHDEVMGYITPQGTLRPNEYVYDVYHSAEGDQPIGILWFSIYHRHPETFAFVAWVEIFEPFQGKGYAQQMMKDAEPLMKSLGAHRIDLNVFGHKTIAQRVYAKCGYRCVRTGCYGQSKVPTRFDLSKSLRTSKA
jgi:RimJ/RimL family protein N-acetyltransferase